MDDVDLVSASIHFNFRTYLQIYAMCQSMHLVLLIFRGDEILNDKHREPTTHLQKKIGNGILLLLDVPLPDPLLRPVFPGARHIFDLFFARDMGGKQAQYI